MLGPNSLPRVIPWVIPESSMLEGGGAAPLSAFVIIHGQKNVVTGS